jgi:hypothetical protein
MSGDIMKNHAQQKINEIFGLQKQAEQHYKDYVTAGEQIKITLASLEAQRLNANAAVDDEVKEIMLQGGDTAHMLELLHTSEMAKKAFDVFVEKSKAIRDWLFIQRNNCARKAKSESNILALNTCDRTKVFDIEVAERVLEKVGSFMEGNYRGTLEDKLDKMKALVEAA